MLNYMRKRYDPKGSSDSKNTGNPRNGKYRDTGYRQRRTKEETGKLFPTFSHSRSKETLTTYGDSDYATMMIQSNDHATANSVTAFKNLMIASYKEGHTSGNMKDVVTAEETSFSVVCEAAFTVIMELILNMNQDEFFANPAESDTNTLTSTRPVKITLQSLILTVQTLSRKALVVPNVVKKLINDIMFVVKFSDEYSVGTVVLPPGYLIPWTPSIVLANLEALITTWGSNNAAAKLHMDKFGIKYSQFSESDLISLPEVPIDSPQAMWMFNHFPLLLRGAAADINMYPDVDLAGGTDWTSERFYFKQNPNECILHALVPLLYAYHATNNPYGGILSAQLVDATQNNFNMMKSAYDNTSTFTKGSAPNIFMRFRAVWTQTDNYNISQTGTDRTGDSDLSDWDYAIEHSLFYGTGLTKTILEQILKNYMIEGMYN